MRHKTTVAGGCPGPAGAARAALAPISRPNRFATRSSGRSLISSGSKTTTAPGPITPAYAGGVTALCTLALLNAGVDPHDEQIQKSLAYLRTLKPTQTYVVSLQTMVFCAAEPKKDLLLIGQQREVAGEHSDHQRAIARVPGPIPRPAGGSRGDPSNSQFALLALYEAERAGVKVSEKTWRLALQYWQQLQNPDGSWSYTKGGPGTGSMTCAGITSLIIASGELNSGDAEVVGRRSALLRRPADQPGRSKTACAGWNAISRCTAIPSRQRSRRVAGQVGCCTTCTASSAPAA